MKWLTMTYQNQVFKNAYKLFKITNVLPSFYLVVIISILGGVVEAYIFYNVPAYVQDIFKNSEINIFIIALGVLLLIVRSVFYIYIQNYLAVKSYLIKSDILNETIRKISYFPIVKLNEKSIFSLLTSESGNLVGYFISPLVILISEIFAILFIATTLFYNFGTSFATSSITIIFTSVLYIILIRNWVSKIGNLRKNAEYERVKYINEWNNLLPISQNKNRTKIVEEKLIKLNEITSKLEGKQFYSIQLPRLWIESVCIPLFIISFFLLNNQINQIELVAILTTVGLASIRIIPSLNRILSSIQTLKYAEPVINEFYEINLNSNVTLDLDILLVNKNSLTAVVGPSGFGKSTWIRNLLDFEKINLTDGNIIKILNKDMISYSSQNHHTFTGTLAENLSFYNGAKFSDDELISALKVVNLDRLLKEFGLHKILINDELLSGGERVRLAVTRSILHASELLVLDEPTNGLDEENVNSIIDLIKGLPFSVLVISHDERLIKIADNVIVHNRLEKFNE